MRIKITAPQSIHATIQLPASKSISNRALIIQALGNGHHQLGNLSDCDDTQVMIRALQAQPGETIDIMAAGTAMRFLTAYFSVTPGTRILTGTERMKQRPIGILVDALRELGADIEYIENEGFPPLRITGKTLSGSHITLPGNVSSQYISALLMIGPKLENGLNITLTGTIISLPYINMTLQLMADFGGEPMICRVLDAFTADVMIVDHQLFPSLLAPQLQHNRIPAWLVDLLHPGTGGLLPDLVQNRGKEIRVKCHSFPFLSCIS